MIRAFGVEVLLAGIVSHDFTSTLKPDGRMTGWGLDRVAFAEGRARDAPAIASARCAANLAVRYLVPRATRGINETTDRYSQSVLNQAR